jgi:ATP-dependent Clp protease ATP-binding subunit ClpA
MARLIQEHIKRPLAEAILFGDLAENGGIARIDVTEDRLVLICVNKQSVELA